MQQTLKHSITIDGIGLHSGAPVSIVLRPAGTDDGIVFRRKDFTGGDQFIPALYNNVIDTNLCTVIANKDGAKVMTIEHLMAAFRGCGVDNVLVELQGPEIPLMDGSSIGFVKAIERAGLKTLSAPRRAIKILKDVTVRQGDTLVRLSPSDIPTYTASIDFPSDLIGRQTFSLDLVGRNFIHDVADCRTFGRLEDKEKLHRLGLGKGASLDNVIVLDRGEDGKDRVLNEGGLRHTEEFVRHKLLDSVGDLALAGRHIIGAFYGHKPGHTSNNAILHALYADTSAWKEIDLNEDFSDTGVFSPHAQPRRTALAS